MVGAPIQMMQGTISMGGPFNLGALAPMLEEGTWLHAFLGAINVPTLWAVFVTAIGLGVLYRRKTTGIAITLIALYLVIVGVMSSVMPSMFGGGSGS